MPAEPDARPRDISDVRQEAMLGAYKYLQAGGDPDSIDILRAAMGQVVKEVCLIVGPEMSAAIVGAVRTVRQDVANGLYDDVIRPLSDNPEKRRFQEHWRERAESYWEQLGSEVQHRTPRERFRICLLQLGIIQSPERIAEMYLLEKYGYGPTLTDAEEAALDKFHYLISLGLPEVEGFVETFHRQLDAALAPAQRDDARQLRPWLNSLLATTRSQIHTRTRREMGAMFSRVARERALRRGQLRHSHGTTREARSGTTSHSGSRRVKASSSSTGPPGDDPPGRARGDCNPGRPGETYNERRKGALQNGAVAL